MTTKYCRWWVTNVLNSERDAAVHHDLWSQAKANCISFDGAVAYYCNSPNSTTLLSTVQVDFSVSPAGFRHC